MKTRYTKRLLLPLLSLMLVFPIQAADQGESHAMGSGGQSPSHTASTTDLTTMTFNVDMTDAMNLGIFDPTTDLVAVAGSFQNYTPVAMAMVNSEFPNLWQLPLDIAPGTYFFKFIILYPSEETLWEMGEDRVLGVTDRDWNIELLDFRVAGLELMDAQISLYVNMQNVINQGAFLPNIDQVFVSGNFNDGQPVFMELDSADNSSRYFTAFPLNAGDYNYAYAILRPDGSVEWELDQDRGFSVPEPQFGSYVTIAAFDDFGFDGTMGEEGAFAVTFNIDMASTLESGLFTPGLDAIAIAGEFNDWAPELLTMSSDSISTVFYGTYAIDSGWYEYKYVIVQSSGAAVWELGVNRSLFVGQNDVSLPLATFNSGQVTLLTGWVLDSFTGQGISGAQINLTSLNPQAPELSTGITDSTGFFAFAELSPVPLMAMIQAEGYLPVSTMINYPEQSTFTVALDPLPAGQPALINGSVLQDSSGLPVASAVIAAISMEEEGVYMANLDAGGNFQITLPADTYILLALGIVGDPLDPEGFGFHYELWEDAFLLEDATSLTLLSGEVVNDVNFIFPSTPENSVMAGNMVMGSLSHSEGVSVDGSMVYLMDAHGAAQDSSLINMDGTFSFSGLTPEATYGLKARHAAYGETFTAMVSASMIEVESLEFSVLSTDKLAIPETFGLSAYPNPFNPRTTLDYSIAETGPVTLEIYNLKGQRVVTLLNTVQDPGRYTALWNGLDANLTPMSTGVYMAVLRTISGQETLKLLYLK